MQCREELSTADPDNSGKFRILLPEGKYSVRSSRVEQTLVLLPSEIYNLDLQNKNSINFEVLKEISGKNEVTILVKASGTGAHTMTIRTSNLEVSGTERKASLKTGEQLTMKWKCRIISPDESWVAVVVPDNEINKRKEIIGSLWEK